MPFFCTLDFLRLFGTLFLLYCPPLLRYSNKDLIKKNAVFTLEITKEFLLATLKKHFGYNSFRSPQDEIISHVLEGKDTVVLMPTGGGKSICFQLPSLVLGGLTLVVSPLISLMKDQVEALRGNGIAAAYLNSSLSSEQQMITEKELENGTIRLLYVSPERVLSSNFISYLRILNLKLIAIDEAHCVSSWGHHFRPEYQKLHLLKKAFPSIPSIALTATADKAVRSDIGELLGMKNHKTFISSFDRPNLSLSVLPGQKKWEQILAIAKKYDGKSGIIYCNSRKSTESLYTKLVAQGFKAACYHAGMPNRVKEKSQEAFIQGHIDIMCATVAFGMGIDKPDIRYVIHHNMPGNLEGFYQEIGRAGRDGKKSDTILFYSYRDVQMQLNFINDINHEQYKKIQTAKLQRMQEYAEAQVCRRKILLSYFSETLEEDCGNCDVCKNPPEYFDGTLLAQKALSAIARTKQSIGLSTTIEVLKGQYSETVRSRALASIKTFGAGKDTTAFAWQLYLQQMVQQGIIAIDYKDKFNLKLTDFSWKILKGETTVKLVKYEIIKERQAAQKKAVKKTPKITQKSTTLFDHLKDLRRQLAAEISKPAFVIFGDASLRDMSEKAPTTLIDFLEITGVGDHKAEKYGNAFLKIIRKYKKNEFNGSTHDHTWELHQQGKTLIEIAESRGISPTTVYSHFAHLVSSKKELNIFNFIDKQEFRDVERAVKELGLDDKQIKPYFDFLEGELAYGKIRLAIAYLKKEAS